MPRQSKSPTRIERRVEALRRAGVAQAALLDPAFADAAFTQVYVRAIRAYLRSKMEEARTAAVVRVLRGVGRFTQPEDQELVEDVMFKQFLYEVNLQGGKTPGDALAAVRAGSQSLAKVPRLQARHYPIATGNPARIDQRGTSHQPLSLSATQRDEVRQVIDDVFAEQPRRGRPTGLEMSAPEFAAAYRKAMAELRERNTRPIRRNIATNMGLTEYQLRSYLRRYGEPGD